MNSSSSPPPRGVRHRFFKPLGLDHVHTPGLSILDFLNRPQSFGFSKHLCRDLVRVGSFLDSRHPLSSRLVLRKTRNPETQPVPSRMKRHSGLPFVADLKRPDNVAKLRRRYHLFPPQLFRNKGFGPSTTDTTDLTPKGSGPDPVQSPQVQKVHNENSCRDEKD